MSPTRSYNLPNARLTNTPTPVEMARKSGIQVSDTTCVLARWNEMNSKLMRPAPKHEAASMKSQNAGVKPAGMARRSLSFSSRDGTGKMTRATTSAAIASAAEAKSNVYPVR